MEEQEEVQEEEEEQQQQQQWYPISSKDTIINKITSIGAPITGQLQMMTHRQGAPGGPPRVPMDLSVI